MYLSFDKIAFEASLYSIQFCNIVLKIVSKIDSYCIYCMYLDRQA